MNNILNEDFFDKTKTSKKNIETTQIPTDKKNPYFIITMNIGTAEHDDYANRGAWTEDMINTLMTKMKRVLDKHPFFPNSSIECKNDIGDALYRSSKIKINIKWDAVIADEKICADGLLKLIGCVCDYSIYAPKTIMIELVQDGCKKCPFEVGETISDTNNRVCILHPTANNRQFRWTPMNVLLDYIYAKRKNQETTSGKYHLNEFPKLSSSSKKPIDKFKEGDFLYCTIDGQLTGDKQTDGIDNEKLAVCILPSMHSKVSKGAVFCALCYLSTMTPENGSKTPDYMVWTSSNYKGQCYVERITHSEYNGDYVDHGEWYTQKIYDYLNEHECDQELADGGYVGGCSIPPATACFRFHPYGTKKGDWFIPSHGQLEELEDMLKNETNGTLSSIFMTDDVPWSSTENSDDSVFTWTMRPTQKSRHHPVIPFIHVV